MESEKLPYFLTPAIRYKDMETGNYELLEAMDSNNFQNDIAGVGS